MSWPAGERAMLTGTTLGVLVEQQRAMLAEGATGLGGLGFGL